MPPLKQYVRHTESPIANRALCFIDFEAGTINGEHVPIEAGIVVFKDGEIINRHHIYWKLDESIDLRGFGYTGRNMNEFKTISDKYALSAKDANAAFINAIPEYSIIIHYGSGIDLECLRFCYKDNGMPLLISDALVALPKKQREGILDKQGYPVYEPYKLKDIARMYDIVMPQSHNGLYDAIMLCLLVTRHFDYKSWKVSILFTIDA